MPSFTHEQLAGFACSLFTAAGTPPDLAAVVAGSLVDADLCGHESHGVMRVPRYIDRIRDGTMQPGARPNVARREGATAVVDGGWGFGQVSAHFGTQLAIEICRDHGIAGVSLSNAHHIGRSGEYAATMAQAGLAAMLMTAGGNRGGSVAVHGSRERLLGTNPLALAVPAAPPHPQLVMDFATSAVPEGRVQVARTNGRQLQPGCVIDRDGRPSTNPADFYDGGALLPFGAHKGSALMLMIEILATTLAGSVPISSPRYRMGNPTLIIAWSVERFVGREDYQSAVEELLARIKASSPAEGFSEVLLPGEIESRRRSERMVDMIPLSDGVWVELTQLAASLSVGCPTPVSA